jgi:hypothetical protein
MAMMKGDEGDHRSMTSSQFRPVEKDGQWGKHGKKEPYYRHENRYGKDDKGSQYAGSDIFRYRTLKRQAPSVSPGLAYRSKAALQEL